MIYKSVSYLLLVIFVITPTVISNDISTHDILPNEETSKSLNEQSSSKVTFSKAANYEEGHCDSDNSKSDSCQNVGSKPKPNCLKFDPETFKTLPSLITYFPFGRLGNTISAYLVKYY